MTEPTDTGRVARVRALNDLLRTTGIGGRIVMTVGVSALALDELRAVIDAVRGFDTFSPDNDPHGEHDCAELSVGDASFIWKIDYYELTLTGGSPDPSDPNITARVLTIMLAEEY